MTAAPDYTDGLRLDWWAKLRWRLGFVPWHRCPGKHVVVNLYGDAIHHHHGMRSACINCTKRWPSLWRESNEVGFLLEDTP